VSEQDQTSSEERASPGEGRTPWNTPALRCLDLADAQLGPINPVSNDGIATYDS
jgi:hypothetical protein